MAYYAEAHTERKYYKYGTTPNVTLTGNVTVSNGSISNFSSSNYATGYNAGNSTSIQVYLKVTPTNFSQAHNVVFSTRKTNNPFGFHTDGRPSFYTGSWTHGVTSYSANQTVWLRLIWNGSTYILYSLRDSGYTRNNILNVQTGWRTEVTWSKSTDILSNTEFLLGRNNNTTSEYFGGSIDLKNSFILTDNNSSWDGTLIEQATSADYDFYRDEPVYKGPYVGNKYKAIRS